MPRAMCRCGESLIVPSGGDGRVVCPRCSAKVKVRVTGPPPPSAAEADGFLRFFCPCGRRLKVDAADPPAHGKCPDCGQIVPVPSRAPGSFAPGHPETPTEELTAAEASMLEIWSQSHRGQNGSAVVAGGSAASTAMLVQPFAPKEADRAEVGLRVCPACGRPVHLGAETCRGCGAAVPKR